MDQSRPLAVGSASPGPSHLQVGFYAAAGILAAIFSLPLARLFVFAARDELYSHIVLLPFASAYLVWSRRRQLPPGEKPAVLAGILLGAAGFAAVFGWVVNAGAAAPEDRLAYPAIAFVFFLGAIVAAFLGTRVLRAVAFPVGVLLFLAPFPTPVVQQIETFLQHGSAAVADVLFNVAGTPVYYQELIFRLPGIALRVAPECSGIHSSLALLITSLFAGHFFLGSGWKRALLALAVVPLALVRNGLRIFVIGELCVRIGPEMIDSYIHHHGGPIFFVLSLVPFSILLILLIRSDRRANAAATHKLP